MKHAIWTYPWDIIDDPHAAAEIAALGLETVGLAATYHTTRAITPHNPKRRLVYAQHAATYFPPNATRYANLRLFPTLATWVDSPDPFGEALQKLQAAGLRVTAWTVFAHNSLLGRANLDLVLENAFGDKYDHALCPAQAEVRAYFLALLSDLVSRYPLDGITFEALSFMGFDHLSHHEKNGVKLDLVDRFLLSLCFCSACRARMGNYDLDVAEVRHRVKQALAATFAGQSMGINAPPLVNQCLAEILGAETWLTLSTIRDEIQLTLLDEALACVPASMEVNVFAAPTKFTPAAAISADLQAVAARRQVNRLIHGAFGNTQKDAVATMSRTVGAIGKQAELLAYIRASYPDFEYEEQLLGYCAALLEAGVSGICYYHYGLCTRPNLQWIANAVRSL